MQLVLAASSGVCVCWPGTCSAWCDSHCMPRQQDYLAEFCCCRADRSKVWLGSVPVTGHSKFVAVIPTRLVSPSGRGMCLHTQNCPQCGVSLLRGEFV